MMTTVCWPAHSIEIHQYYVLQGEQSCKVEDTTSNVQRSAAHSNPRGRDFVFRLCYILNSKRGHNMSRRRLKELSMPSKIECRILGQRNTLCDVRLRRSISIPLPISI